MSTNMWILTNGLNCGPTNYICSAIENELKKSRLKRTSQMENFPLLFGISFANDLHYGDSLSDSNCNQVSFGSTLRRSSFLRETRGGGVPRSPNFPNLAIHQGLREWGVQNDDFPSYVIRERPFDFLQSYILYHFFKCSEYCLSGEQRLRQWRFEV